MIADCLEIKRILVSTLKTAKENRPVGAQIRDNR